MKIIFLFALILFSACITNRTTPDQKPIVGSAEWRLLEVGPCDRGAAPLGCFDPTPDPCLVTEVNLRRCEQDFAAVPVQQGKPRTVKVSSNDPAAPGDGDEPAPQFD